MRDVILEEIQTYRGIVIDGDRIDLHEAPNQQELQKAQKLINGPDGQKWLDYASEDSGISRSDFRDLIMMSPEEFGRKHRANGAYLGAKHQGHNSAEAVRDVAERWRDRAVRKLAQAPAGHPQSANAQQQASAAAQTTHPQGRAAMDPIEGPGDRQQAQQQSRGGGSSGFNDAFKQARLAGKTEFSFNGKRYHTRRKGEPDDFWQAKMKFLGNPNNLSPNEIKVLRKHPGKLGPGEKKRIDALTTQSTRPAATPSRPTTPSPTAQAPAGGGARQQFGGNDFARRVRDNTDYAREVISRMQQVESRSFKTTIITEADSPDEILSILTNPNHPRHEEYASRFRQAERRMKATATTPTAPKAPQKPTPQPASRPSSSATQTAPAAKPSSPPKVDMEPAPKTPPEATLEDEIAKLEDRAAGGRGNSIHAAEAREIYRRLRRQGKSPKDIGDELVQKGYHESSIFWKTTSRPYRALYLMMTRGGLYRGKARPKDRSHNWLKSQ